VPLTTPIESPQSNGMTEAFVNTLRRDYVSVNPTPDARTILASLSRWIEHYNAMSIIRTRRSGCARLGCSDASRSWWSESPCPEMRGQHQQARRAGVPSKTGGESLSGILNSSLRRVSVEVDF
jgi:hypothetical protein